MPFRLSLLDFLITVTSSSTNSLLINAIKRIPGYSGHVEITSTIHTDCWRGYNGLMAGGFAAHLTVNHCNHLTDPVAGIHTNTIESQWRLLHKRLTRGGIRKRDMDVHIAEYLWRRDCESRNADPFQEFIEDIRKVYPVH